ADSGRRSSIQRARKYRYFRRLIQACGHRKGRMRIRPSQTLSPFLLSPHTPVMVPSPSDSFTRARRIELIALFGVLTVFTPIGIDLYLPALPTIARDFGTPIAAI